MRLIQNPNDHSGGIGDLPVTFVYSSSTCFGVADEREQIQLVVSEQQRVAAVEGRADVERRRRRGVREQPVAAVAHEERDRLVHPFALGAVGVVDRQHQPLPALVEAREGLAAAEQLLASPRATTPPRRCACDPRRGGCTRTAAPARACSRSPPGSGSASAACRAASRSSMRHGFSETVTDPALLV